jgi:hypothetical protein
VEVEEVAEKVRVEEVEQKEEMLVFELGVLIEE